MAWWDIAIAGTYVIGVITLIILAFILRSMEV